jgi:hypothetical protein
LHGAGKECRTRRGTSTEGAGLFSMSVSIESVLSVIGDALPPLLCVRCIVHRYAGFSIKTIPSCCFGQ